MLVVLGEECFTDSSVVLVVSKPLWAEVVFDLVCAEFSLCREFTHSDRELVTTELAERKSFWSVADELEFDLGKLQCRDTSNIV